jgi:hypothetical protein
MPNYQDMCIAAKNAQTEFFAYRDRCFKYLNLIVEGLHSHCGVPDDQITYLKWNGKEGTERWYSPAENGRVYSLPGAVAFDESDGFWHLGLSIGLTPENELPKQRVAFVICVAEQGETVQVKMGIDAKPKTVFIHNEQARNLFCEGIAQGAITAFNEAKKKPKSDTIRFRVNLE